MPIDVPREFESFIESLVARRRFLSESEVLAESLRLLRAQETLAEEVEKGFAQIEAGECKDGRQVISSLRERLAGGE